ncbi:MAG TPA: hypothetical protein PLZ82_04070 [Smithellaceae bacterium]|nr:hypothetical protein [Smithellaceae bacterium]HQJ77048.1 hypothetical protein [Smithellaceae bacterium]
MKNKFQLLLMLSTILIVSLPSICFSELKTVEHEYCDFYLGDLKNKKKLNEFRKKIKQETIEDYVFKNISTSSFWIPDIWVSEIISKYIEKVITVSHTENNRKICDKIKITYDQEVWDKYISKMSVTYSNLPSSWEYDVNNVLKNKSDKINIGLIVETKIPGIDSLQKEKLENEQEEEFYKMTQWKENNDKYKYLDRRHLNKVLEEQKLSSSGLTDSDTVKIGKLLNLDIIVLRLIYNDRLLTKVLKVDTGEVLLFKTFEKRTLDNWVKYGEDKDNNLYFYKKIGSNDKTEYKGIRRVWLKLVYTDKGRKNELQFRRDNEFPTEGLEKLSHALSLFEIDCEKLSFQTNSFSYYNMVGEKIYDDDTADSGNISPDSLLDLLREKVCD